MNIDIDLTFLILGIMYPLCIFLFCRKLLENYRSWKVLVFINSVIAILGIWFTIVNIGNGKINLSYSLAFPLYSTLIYRILLTYFIKKKQRKPVDTTLNFAPGLFADRTFNFSYGILIIIVPLIIAGFFSIF